MPSPIPSFSKPTLSSPHQKPRHRWKWLVGNAIQYNTIQYKKDIYLRPIASILNLLVFFIKCSISRLSACLSLRVWSSFYMFVYPCLCLSVCLFVFLFIFLSVCLFVCLSVSLSVCLSVCMRVCLCVCLSVCLTVCPSTYLFVCLSVCMYVSAFLWVWMSVFLSICVSVYLCVCLNFAWRQESIPIINLILFPISLDLSFSIPLSPLLSCLQMSSLGRFMRLSRFKKLMLEAVAFSLTPAQITILRAEFNAMDTDRYIHSSVHRRFPNAISVTVTICINIRIWVTTSIKIVFIIGISIRILIGVDGFIVVVVIIIIMIAISAIVIVTIITIFAVIHTYV